MKPTLLVLAAGLGTRYGGLKQIDSVGPHGETIIDYSIYDAIQAGFGKVVFVIRHYFEDAFQHIVSSKFDGRIDTAYAYQELDACLGDFPLPPDREKPWGTGHAVLVSHEVIHEPFAMINADDYYGTGSFETIARFLTHEVAPERCAMIGYVLRNTLSEYGAVARGVTEHDEQMFLKSIVERKKIERTTEGARYLDAEGTAHALTGDEIVSMNLWGFHPSLFPHLQAQFDRFLREHGQENNAELYIPFVVNELVIARKASVKILPTRDTWFGVTYRADRPVAAACIRRLIDQGVYPERLWG
jgi:UTP-glucose-1-phosphate uridylyltransferase